MSLNFEVAVLGTSRPTRPSLHTQKSSSWASGFGFVFFSPALVPRSPWTRGRSREPRHLRASGSPSGGAAPPSWPEPPRRPVLGRPHPPARPVWSRSGELVTGANVVLGVAPPWRPSCTGRAVSPGDARARPLPFTASGRSRCPDVGLPLAAGTLLFVIVNKCPGLLKCPGQRTSRLSF